MDFTYLAMVLTGALLAGLAIGYILVKLINRNLDQEKNGNHAA